MIVVKIELWPGGIEARAREIQRVLIANVGGTAAMGEYNVVIPKSAEYANRTGVWRRGVVKDFPRQRLGPVDLLLRALIACCGDRSRTAVRDNADASLGSEPFAAATE